MKSEVRSQKSEVVFVTGIRATFQKHFALKSGVVRPNYFDKYSNAIFAFHLPTPPTPPTPPIPPTLPTLPTLPTRTTPPILTCR